MKLHNTLLVNEFCQLYSEINANFAHKLKITPTLINETRFSSPRFQITFRQVCTWISVHYVRPGVTPFITF